ncbi:MAG: RloB domain-containing protein [Moraxellaceae bacterium]|nr:RloB domain-containing protein [Moraxellaceae bacterium]
MTKPKSRSHTANPSAVQVVQYAKDLFENGDAHKGIWPRAFEKIYAVFDRDDHESYFQALRLAESLNGKLRNDAKQSVSFMAIASVPSFELWLLLHFEDIKAPIHRDEVLKRLKAHLPTYQKGITGVFAMTCSKLNEATQRANQLAEQFNADTVPEPFTAVVELVELLTRLRA